MYANYAAQGLAVLTFFTLLIVALYLFISMYVCDGGMCKAFKVSKEYGEPGSRDFTIKLLSEVFRDGLWPFPYLGAALITVTFMTIAKIPMYVTNFGIFFLITFIILFFMFSFFGHHYIKPIINYTTEYIEDGCPIIVEDTLSDLFDEDMVTFTDDDHQ